MPHPLDQLARLLSRHGIPRKQVARYVEELRDHREDLILELEQEGVAAVDAPRLADQRIGDAKTLAESLIAAHRRRSFMGRHPWFFFAILPALAVPLTIMFLMALTIFGIMGVNYVVGPEGSNMSARGWQVVGFAAQAVNYVWPGLLGILIYRACWRRGLGWKWRIVSCASAIAWGAWLHCWSRPGDESHQGLFAMGSRALPHPTQALAAIAWIALWAWHLDRRARRTLWTELETAPIPDGAIR